MRLSLLATIAFTAVVSAQVPQYRVTPALRPGDTLNTLLTGLPGQGFFTFIDTRGGPVPYRGETFYLSLVPLIVLDSGLLPANGQRALALPTRFNSPVGLPIFLQSLVLDRGAPNGSFRLSDGESATFYNDVAVLVEDFDDPVAAGITGTYDQSVRGRLQGGAATRRTKVVVPPGGTPFGQPVIGPLSPWGCRAQMIYRAEDFCFGTGFERITAMRWKPLGPVIFDRFDRVVISLNASQIVPNYTTDPFTLLPMFPNSGLTPTFAANALPVGPIVVHDGPYAINPANLRPDGFLDYPMQVPYPIGPGTSLLIDFKVAPSPNALGLNGAFGYLMSQASPRPNSRARDCGSPPPGMPVNPFTSTTATSLDNFVQEMQFELTRVDTQAVSPWRPAPIANPSYQSATLARSIPPGTTVLEEFQGADDASGSNPTIWCNCVQIANGKAFLRWRLTFVGAPAGPKPSVDAIVITAR